MGQCPAYGTTVKISVEVDPSRTPKATGACGADGCKVGGVNRLSKCDVTVVADDEIDKYRARSLPGGHPKSTDK